MSSSTWQRPIFCGKASGRYVVREESCRNLKAPADFERQDSCARRAAGGTQELCLSGRKRMLLDAHAGKPAECTLLAHECLLSGAVRVASVREVHFEVSEESREMQRGCSRNVFVHDKF